MTVPASKPFPAAAVLGKGIMDGRLDKANAVARHISKGDAPERKRIAERHCAQAFWQVRGEPHLEEFRALDRIDDPLTPFWACQSDPSSPSPKLEPIRR